MDASKTAIDTARRVNVSVQYILQLDIEDADKMKRVANVVKTIGRYYHDDAYAVTSLAFDSNAITSVGMDDANSQAERLANKIVRNYNEMRDVDALVLSYYDSVLGRAQAEAFQNALSMQKHPTLERQLNGETCKWCSKKAGYHTNPPLEVFLRHENCDCTIIVSGYNTRNGLLDNYVKKK